jgi:hypothetical protein
VAYAVIGFGDAGPALASAFARKDIELSRRRSTNWTVSHLPPPAPGHSPVLGEGGALVQARTQPGAADLPGSRQTDATTASIAVQHVARDKSRS